MKKKETVTLVQVLKEMYENCDAKTIPASKLDINVSELNARIKAEIYPQAKKDLSKGEFTDEALIYIKEEAINLFKACKNKGVYAKAPYSHYSDFIEPHIKSITTRDKKAILETEVRDFEVLQKAYPKVDMITAKTFCYINRGAADWYNIFETVRQYTIYEQNNK